MSANASQRRKARKIRFVVVQKSRPEIRQSKASSPWRFVLLHSFTLTKCQKIKKRYEGKRGKGMKGRFLYLFQRKRGEVRANLREGRQREESKHEAARGRRTQQHFSEAVPRTSMQRLLEDKVDRSLGKCCGLTSHPPSWLFTVSACSTRRCFRNPARNATVAGVVFHGNRYIERETKKGKKIETYVQGEL